MTAAPQIDDAILAALATGSLASLVPFVTNPTIADMVRAAKIGKPTADNKAIHARVDFLLLRDDAGWDKSQIKPVILRVHYGGVAVSTAADDVCSDNAGAKINGPARAIHAMMTPDLRGRRVAFLTPQKITR